MTFENGLRDKYKVIRKDTGEECDGCFVLRPVTDKAARDAVLFYSLVTHNPRLGKDIQRWIKGLDAL